MWKLFILHKHFSAIADVVKEWKYIVTGKCAVRPQLHGSLRFMGDEQFK